METRNFMKNTLLIFISLFLLISCEKNDDINKCASKEPPADYIVVSIIDSEGNSLLGINNTYKPSDISLSRGHKFIPLSYFKYDEEIYMMLSYYEMESEKEYELKLNSQETDIINLKISMYNTDCFLYLKRVEKFVLNGNEIQFNGDFYEIQK